MLEVPFFEEKLEQLKTTTNAEVTLLGQTCLLLGRSTSGGAVPYCLVPINSAKCGIAALASSCTNLGTRTMAC